MHRRAKLTSTRLSPLTRIAGCPAMNRSFDRYIKEEGEKLTDGYPRENVCGVKCIHDEAPY